MAMDLIESSADLSSLERISYGGAPASDTIAKEILKRFPKASPYVQTMLSPFYFILWNNLPLECRDMG